MKKWNMIIDVAECTNCQLCALSAMDEYVGNEWPGVAAPMPRHGHAWIDIKQKERGQAPMIDIIATRVSASIANSITGPMRVKSSAHATVTMPR